MGFVPQGQADSSQARSAWAASSSNRPRARYRARPRVAAAGWITWILLATFNER
jgi:hypothetical protein